MNILLTAVVLLGVPTAFAREFSDGAEMLRTKRNLKGSGKSGKKGSGKSGKKECIAYAPSGIFNDRVPGQSWKSDCESCPNGGEVCQLLAESVLLAASKKRKKDPVPDVAIINAGTCANNIDAGCLDQEGLDDVFPFDDQLVLIKLTGLELRDVLREAVEYTKECFDDDDEYFSGAYPVGAGVRFDVDYDSDMVENVVKNVEVNSGLRKDGWSDVDYDAYYWVVTNDFLAGGGDGYETFKNAPEKIHLKRKGMKVRNIFEKYASKREILHALPLADYSTKSFSGNPPPSDNMCPLV